MPVHNVQGPPKIATTVHCISAESIFGQLCVEPFELCYADCLAKLETEPLINPKLSAICSVTLHRFVPILFDQSSIGIALPWLILQLPADYPSTETHDPA